jgi:hypothetical protein
MDPRDRADAALARASARNRWAVTPNNATSPMDSKPTVQIPRVVVNAADPRESDPDTTVVLPGSMAAGQVPVPPQQGQTQQLPQGQQPQGQQVQGQQTQQLPQGQPIPATQQSLPLPHVQPTQQIPAAQQSQPMPHVQQSQPLPHVQQSQPLPHVQRPQQQAQPQQKTQQQAQQKTQQQAAQPDPDQPTKQLPGIIPTTQQNPGRRISLTDRLSGALPETDQP